jgi:hypothetical protein
VTEFHPARVSLDLDSIRDAIEPVEGELLDAHALIVDAMPGGLTCLRCACLEWEAIAGGSGEWARQEYRNHLERVGTSPPG